MCAERLASKIRPIEDPAHMAALVDIADAYRREESKLITMHPNVSAKKAGRRVTTPVTDHEREARERGFVLVLLMLDAGLRIGEAIGLQWRDLDFRLGVLRVRRSISRGKHEGPPKGARERDVQISARLRDALVAWRGITRDNDDRDRVAFVDENNWGKRYFRTIVERAGLPPVDGRAHTPKDLRDTFASHLFSAGAPLGHVQTQLGHTSPLTTAGHYARWVETARRGWEPDEDAGEVWADLLSQIGRKPVAGQPSTP
jgi:integrase